MFYKTEKKKHNILPAKALGLPVFQALSACNATSFFAGNGGIAEILNIARFVPFFFCH